MEWSLLSYDYEKTTVTDKLNLLFDNSSYHINRSFQSLLVINFFQNTNEVQYSLAFYYSLSEGPFQWQRPKSFTNKNRRENVVRKQVYNP